MGLYGEPSSESAMSKIKRGNIVPSITTHCKLSESSNWVTGKMSISDINKYPGKAHPKETNPQFEE